MSKTYTTEEFIEKARNIHGDKYDYSKVNYVNAKTNVEIICPVHGSFFQTPSNHLRGAGCLKCSRESIHSTKPVSKEEFLKRCEEVHGDRYDYSKVDYIDYKTEVEIICKEHGSFFQKPYLHAKGCECPKCGRINTSEALKHTTNEFIEKAKSIHGEKYDYSRVKYVNSNTPIELVCPIHGVFFPTPNNHLNGAGCGKCYHESNILTTDEFIERAKAIHGDKFDYSLVKYERNDKQVDIICPIHGVFKITPRSHLSGAGCFECGKEIGILKITKSLDDFIKEAKDVHGDKYDYSLVDYKNTYTHVDIICPIHGVFKQTPSSHLNGYGCKLCGIDKLIENHTLTTDEFIRRAKNVHGDKYDYSLVEYKKSDEKVKIICKTHGVFEITAHSHISGRGCPMCYASINENIIYTFLNKNNINHEYQKTFNWLKYIANLYLDFYLPDYNIAIEYQGEQHFRPIDFSNTKDDEKINETFEIIKIRDEVKKKLCEEHGIKIYYINYNENTKKKLYKILDINNIPHDDISQ